MKKRGLNLFVQKNYRDKAKDGSRSAHSAGSSNFFDQIVSKMRRRSDIALWWEYSPHSHVTSFG